MYVFSFTVKYGKHSNKSWPANAANAQDSRFHHFQNVMCITVSAGCCNFFRGWMLEQTDSSKDQTGWSASVTAVPAYTYSILFYVTLHCWLWHTKLWWLFLYRLLERMLIGGATAVHRAKHAFLQLSGW